MSHEFPVLLALFGAPWEVLVVLVIALLLFGNRLPDLMRSLGRSVTEFKKGINDQGDDDVEGPKKIDKPPQ